MARALPAPPSVEATEPFRQTRRGRRPERHGPRVRRTATAATACGFRRGLLGRVALVGLLLAAAGSAPAAARPHRGSDGPRSSTVTVHIDRAEGPAVTALAGVTWNAGDLGLLKPFAPPWVRFGARLDEVSPRKGEIDLQRVIDKAGTVRTLGGEPVVTLSQTPEWLARTPPPGCREDRRDVPCSTAAMAPTDLDQWQSLVHDVVVRLAESKAKVTRFEVWNEPNNTRSWADTEDRFVATALASHRAVAAAARETGLDLVLGGPATGEVSDVIGRYVAAAEKQGTRPGFVSWHHYTRDPIDYRTDAAAVRRMLPAGEREPDLVVSEWNHYGRKGDARTGPQGAAFALASLIEMEDAGVDRATIYRGVAVGTGSAAAGLITGDGTRRSSWWVLDAWSDLAGRRVAVDGSAPRDGLWARASRDGDRVDVLLASYEDGGEPDHEVAVRLDGDCQATAATVRRIDGSSRGFDRPERVRLQGLTLRALAPAALWVSVDCGSSGGGPTSAVPSPGAAGTATGDDGAPGDGSDDGPPIGIVAGALGAVLAVAAGAWVIARRRR